MNRALRAPAGSLTSALGGMRKPWRWRGYDIFASEAGQGPLVLLVHGIYAGSSSYEFRKLFPLLARKHRVVAIDLLGSGLSERPNIDYSADLFVDQIVDAVASFRSRRGRFGLQFARRGVLDPGRGTPEFERADRIAGGSLPDRARRHARRAGQASRQSRSPSCSDRRSSANGSSTDWRRVRRSVGFLRIRPMPIRLRRRRRSSTTIGTPPISRDRVTCRRISSAAR